MTNALSMPRLSIIIVTYNSAAFIDACLASLVGQPPATDHEIIVVDNASSDGKRRPFVRTGLMFV